jgi:hypothetical protein
MATTDEVRDCFLGQVVALPDGSLGFGDIAELGREFDAWLTKRDGDTVDRIVTVLQDWADAEARVGNRELIVHMSDVIELVQDQQ